MPGRNDLTIQQLVDRATTNCNVLLAADADSLSCVQLAQHIGTRVPALNYFGIGRGDAVRYVGQSLTA